MFVRFRCVMNFIHNVKTFLPKITIKSMHEFLKYAWFLTSVYFAHLIIRRSLGVS